jgi:hypothetical protein
MVIVPTIRNTGSHFVLRLLGKQHPWRPDILTWRGADRANEDSVVFDHVFPHQKGLFLPLIRDNLTIVPLRHPFLTAKSWKDRNHDKSDLVGMWETMVFDIDPLKPFYLPLDVPDRQDYLDALNEATGLNLVTDWTPRGVKHGNSDLRYQDVSPTPEIMALTERIQPFLDRFYGV